MSRHLAIVPSAKHNTNALLEKHAKVSLTLARERLNVATTVPEVLAVIAMTEAIAGIQRRLKASAKERREALRLSLDAEIELGKLCLAMPCAPRGNVSAGVERPKSKTEYLREVGVSATRVSQAQRLAVEPPKAIETAFKQSNTLSGIKRGLGLHVGSRHVSETKASALDFLANEAIALLEFCIKTKNEPHPGTVTEMRNRLARLRLTT